MKLSGYRSNGKKYKGKFDDNSTEIEIFENLQSIDLLPLAKAKKLQSLSISNGSLREIDLEPLNGSNIEVLDLSINRLSDVYLDSLTYCKKLKALYLYDNVMWSLDLSPLQYCENLEILDLSQNKLSSIDLEPLENCKKLKVLHLSNNDINEINLTPLKNCLELETLTIQENPMAEDCIIFDEKEFSLTSDFPEDFRKFRELADKESVANKENRKNVEIVFDNDISPRTKNQMEDKHHQEQELRITRFTKIIERSKVLKIKQLASILDLNEKDLLVWLYELPETFSFKINDDKIEFEHSSEMSKHIDILLNSFIEWEDTKEGKRE